MATAGCRPCCAYSVTKALVDTHFIAYDSLMSRYKATERHFEKVYGQIEALRADMARKASTAFDSEMTVGEGDMLLGIAKEFKESVPEYEATLGEMACPCCRGVPGLKQAAADMIEASDILRDSYTEGLSAPVVGHDLVSFRMNDFASKAGLACALRKESIERVQLATEFLRVQLSGFQRLQDRMHAMLENVSMHNALKLLEKEDPNSAKTAKKSRKDAAAAAARKSGCKAKGAAVQPQQAERGQSAAHRLPASAAANESESDEEEAEVEPEVVHSNPFAALDAAGKGLSADAASERGSDSGSEASTSTAAHLGGHLHGSGRSSAADSSCDSTSGMHSHMDLAAQRKAILASLRRSSIGASELLDKSTGRSLEQRRSSGHAMNGRSDGRHAAQEQLLSAGQLRAKLGGTAVATQLVQHLCCPITMELIQDPVVAMDGHTYERSAIAHWFEERPAGFSFMTKKRLPSKVLLPNKEYRSLVAQLTG